MGKTTDNSRKNYWLCPLYSFDGYSGNIELAEGIQIKSIAVLPGLSGYIQRRNRDLYGQLDDPSEYNGVILLPYRAKANGVSDPDKLIRIGFEEHDRLKNLLFDLITSLRLCHEGKITAGPLISAAIDNSQWSFGGSIIWTLVSKRDFLHQDPKYVLNQSDVPRVNELVGNLTKLRKLNKPDNMGITLKRFNSSYHGDIEDRIIDQMIAFESLYLGSEQELTYKLATRAAFLLRKRKDHRILVFKNIKRAYSYRSRIVHGDNPPSIYELRTIVTKTEDYLRQSIRKFLLLLSKGLSLKEIRDKLDENILKNGALLA